MYLPIRALALGAYAPREEPCVNSGIIWKPCSGASAQPECTSYQVPLDYAHPEVGNVTLAVARFQAVKQPRLGSIFFNPGGPGGSGVDFILSASDTIKNLANGQYDFVSWDPRGVNHSEPRISCGFTSQQDFGQFLNGTVPGAGVEARGNFTDQGDLDSFFAKVNETDTKLEQFGQKCVQEDGAFLKYMGTAAVVRDLVSLSDALDGPGKPVNFYGISYGTVVGNYFVNMFPERVGRVIIDGVVDSILWATEPSLKLSSSLEDAESTFSGFTQACAQAGPVACALAHSNSTSASIAEEVHRLIDTTYDLHKAGDPDPTHASFAVRNGIFQSLGNPTTWGGLASQLASSTAALNGGTTGKNSSFPSNGTSHIKPRQNPTPPDDLFLTELAAVAIWCMDSIDQEDVSTKQVFDELVRVTHEVSPTFGEVFPVFPPFYCHRFPVRAVERFTGPFNHTLPNPIIVIGNTADPRTPFSSAKRIADNLGSSAVLLKQNGFGHTSLAEHSNCTLGVIRDYFFNGKLPTNGQVCETDQALFPANNT